MSIAFIVDGQTEKKIVQRLCRGSVVRMTGLNGMDVSISAIAKTAASFIKLFKDRYFPVVIIVDRERRSEPAASIEHKLLSELIDVYGVDKSRLIIACPDRMIENWMLADREQIEQQFGVKLEAAYEGCNGKRIMRQLLASRNFIYHETTIGVDLFCRLNAEAACSISESFRRFKNKVFIYCQWLR